jgi:hypothetical protein
MTTATSGPATPVSTSSDSASVPPTSVSFTDIGSDFGRQAITDLGQLGVLDTKSGAFNPSQPITRAEFVRWLVKADNIYFQNDPAHQIRLAQAGPATFVDVPTTYADFPYIQGLANAGYVIGLDATHFGPTQPLTREQMIGIKASLDEGANIQPVDPSFLKGWLPGQFTDGSTISMHFASAIHEDYSVRTTNNIARVWGSLKTFKPTASVTRSEAAVAISQIGSGSAAVALGRTPPPAAH